MLEASWELLKSVDASNLTMRALARHLEVSPNALYSHVANRTALIDLLLDDLLATIPAPSRDAVDPVTALIDVMTAAYQTLTAHPTLVPSYLTRQGARGPHAVQLRDIMDDLLTLAGTKPADVAQVRRALIIHTIGSAAFATAPGEPDNDRPLTIAQSRSAFDQSLRWLLTGATRGAVGGEGR